MEIETKPSSQLPSLSGNPTKTVVGYFHLANKKAHEKLEVKLEDTVIGLKHEACPVYLGVTLDRSLSYKQHCEKINKKVGNLEHATTSSECWQAALGELVQTLSVDHLWLLSTQRLNTQHQHGGLLNMPR